MRTKILYEDKDVLVIEKPAGLATQTAKVGQQDVESELKNYLMVAQPYLGIIHRLDQPVEGVLVFAKNKDAAAKLTKQLSSQGGDVLNKKYYVVICGKPSNKEGTLVDYLDKTKDGRAVVLENATDKGKKAVLHYSLLETAETEYGEISLVEVEIETGRFHQIRVQMAHAQMALLGDKKYSNEKVQAFASKLMIQTVALCAHSIEFIHPTTGKKMQFSIKPTTKAFSYFTWHNDHE